MLICVNVKNPYTNIHRRSQKHSVGFRFQQTICLSLIHRDWKVLIEKSCNCWCRETRKIGLWCRDEKNFSQIGKRRKKTQNRIVIQMWLIITMRKLVLPVLIFHENIFLSSSVHSASQNCFYYWIFLSSTSFSLFFFVTETTQFSHEKKIISIKLKTETTWQQNDNKIFKCSEML